MSKEIRGTARVEFTVRDKMVIADPCYIDKDDGLGNLGDLGVILDGCAGEWVAVVETSHEGSWGERVSILRAARRGYLIDPVFGQVSGWERVNENGVDSGQMFVGCAPCEKPPCPDAPPAAEAEEDAGAGEEAAGGGEEAAAGGGAEAGAGAAEGAKTA